MAGENNLGTLSVKITGDVEQLKQSLDSASRLIAAFTAKITEQLNAFQATITALSRLDRVMSELIKKQSGAARIVRDLSKEFKTLRTDAIEAGGAVQSALGRGFRKLDPEVQQTINAVSFALERLKEKAVSTNPGLFTRIGDAIKSKIGGASPFITNLIDKLQSFSNRTKAAALDVESLTQKMVSAAQGWKKNNIESETGVKIQDRIAAIFVKNSNNISNLVREINRLTGASKGVASALKYVASNTTSLGRSFGHSAAQVNGILKGITGLDLKLKDFITRVVLINVVWKSWNATLRLFRDSLTGIFEFDQQLKNIQAITNATNKEIADLDVTIRRLALKTPFAPAELAKSFVQLGQAGLSAKESIDALEAVAYLSIGSLATMEESAALLTTTLRAFHIESSRSVEVANIFVAALNKSKLTVESLNTAFNFAGSASKDAGLSLQETVAALGILADNGIKASTQATGLRQVLGVLIAPTKQLKEELQRLGVDLNDVNPLFNDLGDILTTLNDAGFRATSAFAALEKRTAGTAGALVKNARAFNDLRDNISGTQSAIIATEIQLSGLEKTSERLRNRLLALFNTTDVREFFSKLLKFGSEAVDRFQLLTVTLKSFNTTISFLGGVANTLGSLIATLSEFPKLTFSIILAAKTFISIKSGLAGLAAAFTAPTLAAKAFTIIMGGLNGLFKAAAITLFINLLGKLVVAWRELNKAMKDSNLALEKSKRDIEEVNIQIKNQEEIVKSLRLEYERLSKGPYGKLWEVSGDALKRLQKAEADLLKLREDEADIISRNSVLIQQSFDKEISKLQEVSRTRLADFNGFDSQQKKLINATNELIKTNEDLTAAATDKERMLAYVDQQDAIKKLRQELDGLGRGQEAQFAGVQELLNISTEETEKLAEKLGVLEPMLVNIRDQIIDEMISKTQELNNIKIQPDTIVDKDTIDALESKLKELETTLLAVSGAINIVTGSALASVEELSMFRLGITNLIKESTGEKAFDALTKEKTALLEFGNQANSELKTLQEERAAILAQQGGDDVAELKEAELKRLDSEIQDKKSQINTVSQKLDIVDQGIERARNKADNLDKQLFRSDEERLKGVNKEIEGLERRRKLSQDQFEFEKQQLDLKLRLNLITEEEARLAGLDIQARQLKTENSFINEQITLLLKRAGVIRSGNIEFANQRREQADADEATAKALEDSIGYNQKRIGLYEEEQHQLSLINQAWIGITQTLEDDVSNAIADMVFETQDLKTGIKDIGTSLKDAFKSGFAASIKEKLHFDTIFKGNMLSLGGFAESTLGQSFSNIFSQIGNFFGNAGLFAGAANTGTMAGITNTAAGLGIQSTASAAAASTIPTVGTGLGIAAASGTAGAGLSGGLMAGLAAVPVWGWIALAAYAAYKIGFQGPMEHQLDKWVRKREGAKLGAKWGDRFYKTLTGDFLGAFGVNKTLSKILNPIGYFASKLGKMFGLDTPFRFLGAGIGRGGLTGAASGAALGTLIFGPIGTAIGAILGGLISSKKLGITEMFLRKMDDIIEPLLTQAFGTNILINAGKVTGRIGKSGFGAANKVETGDNIISDLALKGVDPVKLRQIQEALAAFGFVMGESFVKGKGAALSIKLVNAALYSLWENAANLSTINLDKFLEGLGEKLGGMPVIIDAINEELERLNKKIEKGKSVNPEIYKELEQALKGAAIIFKDDFPEGVDVATKAIRLLRTQGKIDLETLNSEIEQVVQDSASKLKTLVDETLVKGLLDGDTFDEAFDKFGDKFDEFIKQTVFDTLIQAGIQNAVLNGVITPMIDAFNELQIQLQNGEITIEEFGRALNRTVVRTVLPAMETMREVFDAVFGSIANAIGIPLEQLSNLFTGSSTNFLKFTDTDVDKAKKFTEYWSDAADAATDFYDKEIGVLEIQEKINEKEKEIAELQADYDKSGGRETYRKQLLAKIEALQQEIDALSDSIDDINSIDLSESRGEFIKSVLVLKDNIGTVEELIAYYSILQQSVEQGILSQEQAYNLTLAGAKSLQEEMPAAINILELFNAALDENGVLDVNKFRQSVEDATKSFNTLLEAVKQGVSTALSSGDAKKGVDEFAKYLKKQVGDSLLDAFINAITNTIFMNILGPFLTDVGEMVGEALKGNISFDDILQFINDNLPTFMEALGAAGAALEPLLQAIIDIFTETGLIDAYNGALDKQDELISKELDVAKKWEDIFNQAQETRNKILFGEGSQENALAQVTNAQRQLDRELRIFRTAVTSEQKQNSASNLISLINEVFDTAMQAGDAGISKYQKGSLAFQQLQAQLLAVLDEIGNTASTGMSQIDILNQQLVVLNQIAENTTPPPADDQAANDQQDAQDDTAGNTEETVATLQTVVAKIGESIIVQTSIYNLLNTLVSKMFPDPATSGYTSEGYTFNVSVTSNSADAREVADETSKTLIRSIRTGAMGSEIKRLKKPGR